MADIDLSQTTPFASKSSDAPPGMVCDGDVCYFPDEAPQADDDDGPPPLLNPSGEAVPVPEKVPVKVREFPLPGLLAKVTDLVDSDGKPVPKDVLLSLPDKVIGWALHAGGRPFLDLTVFLGDRYGTASTFPPHGARRASSFLPVDLAEFVKSNSSSFAIIYVSADRSQAEYLKNLQGKPFFAVPFGAESVRQALSSQLGVSTIPTLVILKPETCEVVSKAGRMAVMNHLQGDENPVAGWREGRCKAQEAGGEGGIASVLWNSIRGVLPYLIMWFVWAMWVKPYLGLQPGVGKAEKKAARVVAKTAGLDLGEDEEEEEEEDD
ncbi:hypothetical protein DFJ74DRAFT_645464 [Hyaloraphidium curvatum]|nr:hypothetical protein DFJ74DRAFT_645464 [Hyaloraphidium curvatum]